MRPPSGAAASSSQSPALVARIEEKKAELQSLKELQDLSRAVANQMEALEQKLNTLSDGTEGVFIVQDGKYGWFLLTWIPNPAIAAVMSNWHNVLRAINMASSRLYVRPFLT